MIVYKIVNNINNKIYIGKTKYKNKFNDYWGSGRLIKMAINKYGIDNFKKEILEECNSEERLNERERYWIVFYKSFQPIGYNIGTGGEGQDNFTYNPNKEQIRKKISNSVKNSEKFKITRSSKEYREKLSKANSGKNNGMYEKGYKITGKNNGNYGKTFFAKKPIYDIWVEKYGKEIADLKIKEWKLKIKNSNIGKKIPEECKRRISESLIKSEKFQISMQSKERKERARELGKNNSGKNNGMYGISLFQHWINKFGEEIAQEKIKNYKEKMSKSKKKVVKKQ